MINYEHETLVLDSSHTKQDQKAINDFIEQRLSQEKSYLYQELLKFNSQGHISMPKFKLDALFKL